MDHPETVISICSGVGGLDLGLRIAVPALRVVTYVEREGSAVAQLAAACEGGALDAAPIWTDLRTFDGEPYRGRVRGVIGGYPCQGESVAGKQRGVDDPRWLWPSVARIIREVRPSWCFFENVANHASKGFRIVGPDLEELGYRVAAGIFSAEEVGATHKRERIFILAVANDECSEWRPRDGSERRRGERPDGARQATGGSRVESASVGDTAGYDERRSRFGSEDGGIAARGSGADVDAPVGDSGCLGGERSGIAREFRGEAPSRSREGHQWERDGDAARSASSPVGHATNDGRREGRTENELRRRRDAAAGSSCELDAPVGDPDITRLEGWGAELGGGNEWAFGEASPKSNAAMAGSTPSRWQWSRGFAGSVRCCPSCSKAQMALAGSSRCLTSSRCRHDR